MLTRLPFVLHICSCLFTAGHAAYGEKGFFEQAEIPRIKIEVSAEESERLKRNPKTYVHGDVVIDGQHLRDVGVRLKGNGSFRPLDNKPNFAINFDEFLPRPKFRGMSKILLNNSVQDTTYLSEFLASSVFHDVGVPAPRVTHARVALNGKDLGFFVLVEAANKAFLKANFGNADGCLYEGTTEDISLNLKQEYGHDAGSENLARLLAAAQAPDNVRLMRLQEVLDVDRFVAFLAVTMLLAQHDSYPLHQNNYRIYHDSVSDKFVFIPHGVDGTFCRNLLPIDLPPNQILTRALMTTTEGRQLYQNTISNLFERVFRYETLSNRVILVAERLQRATEDDMERRSLKARTATFLDRIQTRHDSIRAQLDGMPRPILMLEKGGQLVLTNWHAETMAGNAVLHRTNIASEEFLYIKALDTSVAAWSSDLLLAPGKYRLQAQVVVSNTVVLAADSRGGASIHLWSNRPTQPPLKSETGQRQSTLEHRFTVRKGEEDIHILCELRSRGGEAWFESNSLSLVRE